MVHEPRTSRIHSLDLRYQDGLHTAATVHRDEEGRRASLRALSLQDHNAELQCDLSAKISYIESFTSMTSALRQELSNANTLARNQEVELTKRRLEIRSLKVEAQAQKSSSGESDNAAKEKSALTQQLSRLQPELEELRAKLTSHHATLAAKENLQRQVDSLETELENEKRLRQQLEANSGDRRAHRELRAKLEQVEKSLMKERKERDVLKKMLEDARNEQEQHGQRPVALKPERAKSGKSQSTSVKRGNLEKEEEPRKSENSHSDLGLERGQAVAEKNRKRSVVPKRQANQTRQTAEISFEDITIQTPGNDWQYEKRLHKKRDDDKKLFGAKSDFSITPFLNKSKGLADDSLDRPSRSLSLSIAEDQVSIGSPAVSAGNENVFIEESPSIQAESHNGLRRRTAKPKKAALMEASDSEVNRSILRGSKTVTKPGPKKRQLHRQMQKQSRQP
ncbi:hypothetical protein K4F52_000741 [Lecanicillium sp. MT-2017a]|nr:hypothetical protein K4F52_000741 [Lecanicillium sp. MT-2017a]